MADIFISYKREDRRFAERLSIALDQLGFEVWWDFDLMSGDRFRSVIREVISKCSAAIVLWSEKAVTSDFVMDEAAFAKANGKLCPARIDGVDLPFGFGQIQTDDLSDWDGELSHPGFQALVRALEGRIGRKAKLGEAQHGAAIQAAAAELDAFKAAQLANTESALRAFMNEHPRGVFAGFVRAQIEAMRVPAMASAPPAPDPPRLDSARLERTRVQPVSASHPEEKKPTPPPLLIGAVVAVALAGGFALWPREPRPEPTAATSKEKAAPLAEETPAPPHNSPETNPPKQQRSTQQEGAASQRTPAVAQPALQQSATPQVAAYDELRLPGPLREAVTAGRASESRGQSAAARARQATREADSAAQRARNGETGYVIQKYPGEVAGLRYEGGWVNNAISGSGISYGVRDWTGDRYAGQWQRSQFSGAGVYAFAVNTANTRGLLRYEGEFGLGKRNGDGALLWRNGDLYAGAFVDDAQSGSGVLRYQDGRRYEGEWANDQYDGYGVLWDSQGQIAQAGVWTAGRLTAATR